MSSTPLAETEEDVFDLTDAVPETERLDSSLQKAKAQLSIKTRRHRPSRSRLRDSLSSTEGEDSLDGKSYSGLLSGPCSPLHVSLRCPSPFSDLHPSSSPARKERAFTFDPRAAETEKKEQKRRSACLLNPSSPTHLLKEDHLHQRSSQDSPQLCQGDGLKLDHKKNSYLHHRDYPQLHQEDQTDLHQGDQLPVHQVDHTPLRQGDHLQRHQENHLHQTDYTDLCNKDHLQKDQTRLQEKEHLQQDQTHMHEKDHVRLHEEKHSLLRQREHSQSEDESRDIGSDEPSSPTVLLDKKTRRRFLDLGVTLRRTYGKVRRERANRHAAENRETDGAESRSSRTSAPPFVSFSWLTERIRGSGSPKSSSQSPVKSLSEDEELKTDSRSSRKESSQPYQSLSDHSDEGRDEDAEPRVVKKKTALPFSSGGRDRTEKQNGVQRDRKDDGHDGDGQKLLTSQSRCKHHD